MSSKRRLRKNGCGSKRRYATIAEAIAACGSLMRRSKHTDLNAYGCRFCRGAHVGHRGRRAR